MKGEEVIELNYLQRKASWPSAEPHKKSAVSSSTPDGQFARWQFLIEALSDFLSLSASKQVAAQCRDLGESRKWSCAVAETGREYEVQFGDGQLQIAGKLGDNTFKLHATQLENKQNFYQIIEVQHVAQSVGPPVSAKFFVKSCQSPHD